MIAIGDFLMVSAKCFRSSNFSITTFEAFRAISAISNEFPLGIVQKLDLFGVCFDYVRQLIFAEIWVGACVGGQFDGRLLRLSLPIGFSFSLNS